MAYILSGVKFSYNCFFAKWRRNFYEWSWNFF